MRLLIFLVLSVSYVCAWGKGDLEKYGPFSIALKMVKCDRGKQLDLDVSGIAAYFYDFPNDDVRDFSINEAAQGILSIPTLDKVKKFFIFVGGYKSGITKNTEERVRQAFKNFPNSYLIIIDHSAYTNNKPGYKKGYERSIQHVHSIGKQLAQMLAGLYQGGISPKNMHCIGHSLGSQILGQVGDNFIKITGEKIWRITALDPAGPCFSNSLIEEQVRSGVAEYVEVYHCNAGGFGTSSVLGDIDFFVNKGQSQPNCGTPIIPGFFDSPKAAKCHHKACVIMWLASVAHPDWYPAYKCDKYKHFKGNQCWYNDKTTAGFWNPGNATGVYYFSTEGYKFE
ncbi:pancreatic triacylglycerol lipase-like [Anticarsia gemmatalis]|uniref:pancreatic triacylglycerol lipase-like n=1 Tax=Anticarsia gemmatalis TaxID=129554 RepID=UPI003F766E4C